MRPLPEVLAAIADNVHGVYDAERDRRQAEQAAEAAEDRWWMACAMTWEPDLDPEHRL